jgi:hypothetical protein
MCAIGGTLDTTVSYRREKKIFADPERQFGRESRALKAAYELLQVGPGVQRVCGGVVVGWGGTGGRSCPPLSFSGAASLLLCRNSAAPHELRPSVIHW